MEKNKTEVDWSKVWEGNKDTSTIPFPEDFFILIEARVTDLERRFAQLVEAISKSKKVKDI